jgi:hypothetical protein
MTTVDLSRVVSALPTLVADRVIKQMNRSAPILQLIQYEAGFGHNLQWDNQFKNASEVTDSTLNEGADVSVYQDDDLVPAVLQWGNYSEAIALTGKAMAIARTVGKPSELADLFATKVVDATMRLAKNIGRDIWTGSGATNRILGLYGGATLTSGAPLSSAGTYASINRATYADWAGNVLANGGVARPLSFQLMRDMRKEIYEACGEVPDLIMCDATIHEKYGMLFNDQRRYTQEITLRGQKFVLDGGYKALEFDGIPIIADINHPAGCMTFLNSNYLRVCSVPDRAGADNRSPGMIDLQVMPEEQLMSGAVPLQARLNPLAVTGDAYKLQMLLYPQLKLTKPNSCGVLSDLQT